MPSRYQQEGASDSLAVAPAAGAWSGAGEGREVTGVLGQPGTVAGPLPAAGSPRCVPLHGTGSVPGESCPQEDLGTWLIRSDRMDTPKLCCLGKKDFSACFD